MAYITGRFDIANDFDKRMDGEMVCNFKKCRKRLNTFAWVTSCSHIFCDEDGTREFNKSYNCPACENALSGKFDIVRVDLQPSEQYKSMVLAGQKPETVMEICTRALSFWTYQAHQEHTYHEYVATKAKERAVQLEQYYEQILSRSQTELSSLKTQLSATRKDLESSQKKNNEISDKLTERSRQYQKLQSLYDAMRRKCITPSLFDGSGDGGPSNPDLRNLQNFSMSLSSGEEFLRKTSSQSRRPPRSRAASPPERDFSLKPHGTPIVTSGGLTINDNSAMHNHFNLPLGTPR